MQPIIASEAHDDPVGIGLKMRKAREALGLSQGKLAAFVGTTQQTIDKLEKGTIRFSRARDKVVSFLNFRNAPSDPGLNADLLSLATEMAPPDRGNSVTIPVFGGESESRLSEFRFPLYFTGRPENLQRVRDAYALQVMISYMTPALREGDIAYINPHVRAKLDDDVILISEDVKADILKVQFGTVISQHASTICLRSWAPLSEEVFSKEAWPACHVIVGRLTR